MESTSRHLASGYVPGVFDQGFDGVPGGWFFPGKKFPGVCESVQQVGGLSPKGLARAVHVWSAVVP